MDIIQENMNINMLRNHLEDIPKFVLPPGYGVKWYQPGDEQLWVDIHKEAEKYVETSFDVFKREFGDDANALKQRQCYLLDTNGQAIGTTTAWFNEDYYGQPYGRVHWVAIIPGMQGKGLSKSLMSIACQRLSDLGHDRAYLSTSTARIPAINLYLKFRFVPEIRNEDDIRAWRGLQEKLGKDLLNMAIYRNSQDSCQNQNMI